MSALQNIRVVELAGEPCAFAGKLMGDMGADVILIEPPGGEPSRGYPPFVEQDGRRHSLHFWHYNTSKRSVVLDIEQADDRAQLVKLLESADILLEAEPPRRLARLGIDYEHLQPTNPRLIHVALTAYGREHPDSELPFTDLTLMAAGGPPWSCGYDDHELPPVRGWGYQGIQTACHYAFMSVLTALLYRSRSGKGQFIDVSMTAALNVTTEAASYAHLVAGFEVQRQTGRHAAVHPTGETQMRCADGNYVNTGVPPRFPDEFGRLLQWLRTLELEDAFPEAVFLEMGANWEGPFDLSRLGTDDTITAIFSAGREALQLIAASIPAYDFFTGCQNAGLSVGVIYAPQQAFDDPHFAARGFPTPVWQTGVGA